MVSSSNFLILQMELQKDAKSILGHKYFFMINNPKRFQKTKKQKKLILWKSIALCLDQDRRILHKNKQMLVFISMG